MVLNQTILLARITSVLSGTYKASIRNNIIKIYFIENDKEWQNILLQKLHEIMLYFFNEMNVQPNTFGHPDPNSCKI